MAAKKFTWALHIWLYGDSTDEGLATFTYPGRLQQHISSKGRGAKPGRVVVPCTHARARCCCGFSQAPLTLCNAQLGGDNPPAGLELCQGRQLQAAPSLLLLLPTTAWAQLSFAQLCLTSALSPAWQWQSPLAPMAPSQMQPVGLLLLTPAASGMHFIKYILTRLSR